MSTALNPLVEKIRGAHPGAYDDMDDAALTKAVLKKYPQYSDLAAPPASAAPGAPASQPMESSHLAESLSPASSTRSAIANPQQPAEQFALDNPDEQGKLAASAAIGAAPGIAPRIARAGMGIMRAHPILSTIALGEAQRLPIIGKYASKIPSWLPLVFGGKEGAASAAAEESMPAAEQGPRFPSGNMRATEGEYVDSPSIARPSGPPVAPSEVVSSRALPASASVARDLPYRRGPGEIAPEDVNAPNPSVLAGRNGVRVPAKMGPRLLNAAPSEAPVARGITQSEPASGRPIPHSEWPPPEPPGPYDKPVPAPRGISDLRDDEAVREGIRARIGQADRKIFAAHRERNDVSVPKGVLTGEINKPVTYTKTSGAKARGVSTAGPAPAGTTVPGPEEDMTPFLKKSLKLAKKGKKGD